VLVDPGVASSVAWSSRPSIQPTHSSRCILNDRAPAPSATLSSSRAGLPCSSTQAGAPLDTKGAGHTGTTSWRVAVEFPLAWRYAMPGMAKVPPAVATVRGAAGAAASASCRRACRRSINTAAPSKLAQTTAVSSRMSGVRDLRVRREGDAGLIGRATSGRGSGCCGAAPAGAGTPWAAPTFPGVCDGLAAPDAGAGESVSGKPTLAGIGGATVPVDVAPLPGWPVEGLAPLGVVGGILAAPPTDADGGCPAGPGGVLGIGAVPLAGVRGCGGVEPRAGPPVSPGAVAAAPALEGGDAGCGAVPLPVPTGSCLDASAWDRLPAIGRAGGD
jgi:hypothetical protein